MFQTDFFHAGFYLLAMFFMWVSSSAYSLTLKMEMICSSEMFTFNRLYGVISKRQYSLDFLQSTVWRFLD
jgi:hypothetical protein